MKHLGDITKINGSKSCRWVSEIEYFPIAVTKKDLNRSDKMEAIWSDDYDSRTDSIYKRPCCPECREPIGLDGGDKYRCYSCGEVVEVTDPDMLKWFNDRSLIKYEYQDCPRLPIDDEGKEFMGCGGKGTLKVMYVRNNATLEWQTAQGKCEKCGMSFIV